MIIPSGSGRKAISRHARKACQLQMISEKYTKEKGDAYVALNPVRTGPHKFVSWKKGQELVVEANEITGKERLL